MAKARVYVTLKKSVFDPQGKTIHEALRSLGYDERGRRAPGQVLRGGPRGLAAGPRRGRRSEEIARRVLANPVIESYRVEVEP